MQRWRHRGWALRDPTGGTNVDIAVDASGRTDHHVVFTVWQASHMDQTFYSCSDVLFPRGDGADTPVAEEPEVPAEELPEADEPAEKAPARGLDFDALLEQLKSILTCS